MGNKFIEKSMKSKTRHRTSDFHYTSPKMVKSLLEWLDLDRSLTVLDAGSGRNKVWYEALDNRIKFECEIEDGCDFYAWDEPVDWVVGNPPFSEGWKFLEKAVKMAKSGVAFLGNINFFSSLTPKRIRALADAGFGITGIRVTQDKRWFGRYYFIVFEKGKGGFITTE